MEKCASLLAELETSLADTDLYSDDRKSELMLLLDKQATLTQQLEEEETAWLDAQEEIEKEREEFENA
jgi:ATP-binding cassette subfamily F protein 3